MSEANKQQHNLDALLIANARLLFCPGALTTVAAEVAGFRDLGNCNSLSIQSEKTEVQHFGSYRGRRVLDKTEVTQSTLKFMGKFDEITADNLAIFLQGERGEALTQTEYTADAVDNLDFSTVNAKIGYWYGIKDDGVRVRDITLIAIGAKVEGTDYEVDYATGRVRFLTAQTTSLSVTVTANAITSTSANGFEAVSLLTNPVQRGVFSILVENKNDPSVAYELPGFYGEIRVNGNMDVDGANFSSLDFMVDLVDTDAADAIMLVARRLVTPTG